MSRYNGSTIPEYTEEDQRQLDTLIDKRNLHAAREALQSCAYFSLDPDVEEIEDFEEIEACLPRVVAHHDHQDRGSFADGDHTVFGWSRRKYAINGDELLTRMVERDLEGFMDPEEDPETQLDTMPESVKMAARELARALSEDWEPWACDQTRVFSVRVTGGHVNSITVHPGHFQRTLLALAYNHPVRVHEISKEFDASMPTVRRWAEGTSAPSTFVQALVLKFIKRYEPKDG